MGKCKNKLQNDKVVEDLRTLICHHMGRIIYRKTQQWPQNFSIGGKLDWKRILGGLCLRNHTFTDIIFLVGMAPIPLHHIKDCYFSNDDLSLFLVCNVKSLCLK